MIRYLIMMTSQYGNVTLGEKTVIALESSRVSSEPTGCKYLELVQASARIRKQVENESSLGNWDIWNTFYGEIDPFQLWKGDINSKISV